MSKFVYLLLVGRLEQTPREVNWRRMDEVVEAVDNGTLTAKRGPFDGVYS
jgi:hypothetical protein